MPAEPLVPAARGPLSAALLAYLRGDVLDAPVPAGPEPRRDWRRRSAARARTAATSCTTVGSSPSRTPSNGIRTSYGFVTVSSAPSPGRSSRQYRNRSSSIRGTPASSSSPRSVPSRAHRFPATSLDDGQPSAARRVRHAPLRVPAQGGGPAHLGDPPLRRPLARRARRDPDGRVRQRRSRSRARRPVRDDDAGARSGPDLRALPGPASGDDARDVEPGVDVRPAPALAPSTARSPGPLRDDLRRADGALRARCRPSWARCRPPAASTTCTS